ncbi:MAG: hypothetical protein M3220_18705 [Chloroflexota bacterium]|nr:hypothetical protein [Chloroflexota bacterium]
MMKSWFALLAAGWLALIACAPIAAPGGEPGATEEAVTGEEEALLADLQWYAEEQGIELEEAARRFEVTESVGALQAELAAREAESFAGLWLQHEPDFRVVVAFTEQGEETLRPYIEGRPYEDLVEVRTHRYTLAELEAAQQEAMDIANQLELSASSGISLQENRVEVTIGNPDLFLEEIQAVGLALPEPVDVLAIDPDNLPKSNRGGIETYDGPGGQTIYFPRQPPATSYMEALLEGELVLDENGCLRVGVDDGYNPLVIWHHDFTLRVAGDTIEVLDGEQQVVGRVGAPFRAGGGEGTPRNAPDECPGPYWILGEIDSVAEQAIPDIWVNPFLVEEEILALVAQQSKPAPEEGVLTGTLTVDEQRCLRVDGYVVLWPPDVWPRDREGSFYFVEVVGEREEPVAVVGEMVRLTGTERQPADYRYFENKVRCSGPYWGVATVEPLD